MANEHAQCAWCLAILNKKMEGLNMKILINSMTQEEVNKYLEQIVESAFREGALWEKCGGEKFCSLYNAISSAKDNILMRE